MHFWCFFSGKQLLKGYFLKSKILCSPMILPAIHCYSNEWYWDFNFMNFKHGSTLTTCYTFWVHLSSISLLLTYVILKWEKIRQAIYKISYYDTQFFSVSNYALKTYKGHIATYTLLNTIKYSHILYIYATIRYMTCKLYTYSKGKKYPFLRASSSLDRYKA